jgi:DNA-binding transcriptional LysR family regulator
MFNELFSHSGISLERLKNFCSIAEVGSIARSAKGDLARQSLMSRQVRELEEFFGVELIRRQGRGIVITPVGQQLAAICREYFKALGDFKAECRSQPVQIVLAASNSLIQWVIMPRIKLIQDRYPGVGFKICHESIQDIVQKVQTCICDFGFVREETIPQGLKRHLLGTISFSLFVPKNQVPKRSLSPLLLLESLRLVLPAGGQLRESVENLMQRKRKHLQVGLECTSYLDAMKAFRGGGYAAVLPTIAKADLKPDEYSEFQLPFLREATRKYYLIWNQRTIETRASARNLLASFKKSFSFD